MPQILSLPNEDILTTGWSAQSGTDFFAMVDETEGAADDDTTYVETAAVNSALILGFQNPPPSDFGAQGNEMVVTFKVNVAAVGNTALVGHSIDGLDAKFYVNGVQGTSVSDGDFVGAAIPTTMFIGGNSAKTSQFSGGLRTFRVIDYARI